ncbi:BTAD domain-containing putative transcriptional regulator [Lentzea sp. BCCO 10_0856]|uniref:BTAD domain-containing putative transcriptional regulator n=1 Tax=Lentzea miocenica TaxID=3095431 RepID=A0ABU4TBH6_9PSEU|nr:BTAD domain-containing putative transcriptional regulator [Lentzea sp. BCCO 10_0856]MDX8035524.1 BTAD domain-containing putative transcriptional regulator [Lentzea sp. BCCO 10_0856]
MPVEFRILGPLEVLSDGLPVALGGPQQRGLLALLLLDANRVVSRDRLVTDLWGDAPPANARGLLHGCVAGLRRVLPAGRLVTRSPGYLLRVGAGELDADRFEELTDDDSPRTALELWRGPALHDIALDSCRPAAVRLDERRLAVLERRVDLDLRLGRFADLAAELTVLVREHPLRERLWAQLMLALYGAGRQSEALAAFRRLRATLVEELGIEPSSVPRQVEQAVLAGGDALGAYWGRSADPVPEATAPAQLPAAISAFTGRAGDLDRLDALLGGTTESMAIAVIAGVPGVGKTTLAVHWAHRVRDRFGGGQLYVNLRGHAPASPMSPIEALSGFLSALGVPAGQIPLDLDRAADLYRTLLADRRMLVLLDDARDVEQVRPLLPGGPAAAVVVTSRYGLGGLIARDGAAHLPLGLLTPQEAHALLVRTLGVARAQADPDATAELARLCGFLPLALRIAAANLTLRPERTVSDHVAELAADDRLDLLSVVGDDETAVRVAFDHSFAALPAAAARLFRLLGLVPGPDFGVSAATALIGSDAGPVLALLADAHLLLRPAPGRYAFHDLLRLYAAEREENDAERSEATGRLLDWYLAGVEAGARTLFPQRVRLPIPVAAEGFGASAEALAWLDAELPNLVAAARLAAEQGPARAAWLLADSLRGYCWLRMCTVEWLAIATAGLTAATSAGDLAGLAAAELSLADLNRLHGRYRVAIEHYTRAVEQARSGGWLDGANIALSNLGTAYFWLGELPAAAEHYRQSLDVAIRTGRLVGEANALGNLGLVHELQGELERAVEHHTRALELHRRLGSRTNEAVNLANLGETYHLLGRFDTAHDHVALALALHREIGDRGAEAESLRVLAEIWLDQGEHDRALDRAVEAAALAAETGHLPVRTNALNTLGGVRLRLGQAAAARADHEHALRLARDANTGYAEVVALTGLAACHLRLGGHDHARILAEHALAEADRVGFRIVAADALTVLLDIHLTNGDLPQALACGERALALHRSTGHRRGEARTALLLDRARLADARVQLG